MILFKKIRNAPFAGAGGVKAMDTHSASLRHSFSSSIVSMVNSPKPSLPPVFFWLQNERLCKGEGLDHCKSISMPGNKTIENTCPVDEAWWFLYLITAHK